MKTVLSKHIFVSRFCSRFSVQQSLPRLLEDPTVNFSLLEEFTGDDDEQPHGSDLKPTEVNAKAHLFQEFADQFLHQQLMAIQTLLPLMSVAVENEMEVLKDLAVEDVTAMPEPAVLNSYRSIQLPVCVNYR